MTKGSIKYEGQGLYVGGIVDGRVVGCKLPTRKNRVTLTLSDDEREALRWLQSRNQCKAVSVLRRLILDHVTACKEAGADFPQDVFDRFTVVRRAQLEHSLIPPGK